MLAVGFVSDHRALDFKPFSDMKMKFCHAENEDENSFDFLKIRISVMKSISA